MLNSTILVAVLGVIAIVSIMGWYSRPNGILEETFSGSLTPNLFLFDAHTLRPTQQNASKKEQELIDYNAIISAAPSTTSPSSASSSSGYSPHEPSFLRDDGLRGDAAAPSTDTTGTPSSPTAQGEVLTAWIHVQPSLVKPGASATLSWSSTNADECLITGSGNKTWDALSSAGVQTGPIIGQATFTLTCKRLDGDHFETVTKSASARTAPSFSE